MENEFLKIQLKQKNTRIESAENLKQELSKPKRKISIPKAKTLNVSHPNPLSELTKQFKKEEELLSAIERIKTKLKKSATSKKPTRGAEKQE